VQLTRLIQLRILLFLTGELRHPQLSDLLARSDEEREVFRKLDTATGTQVWPAVAPH
jgi:hypothetical protein